VVFGVSVFLGGEVEDEGATVNNLDEQLVLLRMKAGSLNRPRCVCLIEFEKTRIDELEHALIGAAHQRSVRGQCEKAHDASLHEELRRLRLGGDVLILNLGLHLLYVRVVQHVAVVVVMVRVMQRPVHIVRAKPLAKRKVVVHRHPP